MKLTLSSVSFFHAWFSRSMKCFHDEAVGLVKDINLFPSPCNDKLGVRPRKRRSQSRLKSGRMISARRKSRRTCPRSVLVSGSHFICCIPSLDQKKFSFPCLDEEVLPRCSCDLSHPTKVASTAPEESPYR